jgi:hypothetical protein
MKFNIILTFDHVSGKYDDPQEIYDVLIPISTSDKKYDAITFLNRKLFPSIINSCLKFNRKHEDIIKISTCGDWDLYEKFAGKKSLPNLDHSCKWFFGENRIDLDEWEKNLMSTYGFGTFTDMAYTTDLIKQINAKNENYQAEMQDQ